MAGDWWIAELYRLGGAGSLPIRLRIRRCSIFDDNPACLTRPPSRRSRPSCAWLPNLACRARWTCRSVQPDGKDRPLRTQASGSGKNHQQSRTKGDVRPEPPYLVVPGARSLVTDVTMGRRGAIGLCCVADEASGNILCFSIVQHVTSKCYAGAIKTLRKDHDKEAACRD